MFPKLPAVDLIRRLLEPLSSLAETIGACALAAIGFILPVALTPELAAPIGWLALLTGALALGEAAKRLTWVIVGLGWALIVIRIALEVVRA